MCKGRCSWVTSWEMAPTLILRGTCAETESEMERERVPRAEMKKAAEEGLSECWKTVLWK